MKDVWQALTRASGLVAAVAVALALISGLLFSARETGERRRPAWWLDLHNGLGGLALAATGVHVVASLLDAGVGVGIAEAVVPGVADTDRLALAGGVIAMYLLGGAVFTTWPRRIRDRRLWRMIHLGSTVGVALAFAHGYKMGTDATRLAFQIGLVVLAAPMTYSIGVRATDAAMRAGARSKR